MILASRQTGEVHRTCRIARNTDGQSPPAEADIAQRERAPAAWQCRRKRVDEPGFADPEPGEAVRQTLQVRAGARQERTDFVARSLRADIVRRLERPAGLEQLGPGGRLSSEIRLVRRGHAREDAHADLADGTRRVLPYGVMIV